MRNESRQRSHRSSIAMWMSSVTQLPLEEFRRRRHVERGSADKHFDQAVALVDQIARVREPNAQPHRCRPQFGQGNFRYLLLQRISNNGTSGNSGFGTRRFDLASTISSA